MQSSTHRQYTHEFWINEVLQYQKSHNNNITDVANKLEVPVCAIIVKENKLVSIATNKVETYCDPTAHSEIYAIREASKLLGRWRLNGCTMYVTLEPCPMCMGAILNSRISKLVFGAYDLSAGACFSLFNLSQILVKENQIEIIGGILELDCSKILKDFFTLIR